MSTKITVAYGDNFHLYRESLDEDYIYLEMEGVQQRDCTCWGNPSVPHVQFEASYNQVMMPIPIHIWEVIRQYQGIDLSWAAKTDEEIMRHVEQEVDRRIEKYQQADDEKHQRLIALLGAIPYGSADTPRQQQIDLGIAYFHRLREHQQQIKQAIEQLEKINQNP
jgi:hypothetical protein